jgi:hypothetical protein
MAAIEAAARRKPDYRSDRRYERDATRGDEYAPDLRRAARGIPARRRAVPAWNYPFNLAIVPLVAALAAGMRFGFIQPERWRRVLRIAA